jgi:hypothetical protein
LNQGKGDQKGGKGKGMNINEFPGVCYQCGQWGHSAKYCGGKSQGKGGKSASAVWNEDFAYQPAEHKQEPEEEMNLGPPADASVSAVNIDGEPWVEVTRGRSRWPKSILASSTHPCSFVYPSNINLLEFASVNPTISAVNQHHCENRKGWSLIKIQIDSGAIDHVMPPGMAPSIKIHPIAASIAGKGYSAANGTKIANHGEKTLKGITETGAPFSMNIQCADVTRALGSVYRLNQCGNSVVLNGKNSYMLHITSGIKTPITLENGKYMLSIWVQCCRRSICESYHGNDTAEYQNTCNGAERKSQQDYP